MIQLSKLEIVLGREFALRDINLHVPAKSYTVLMGRTGSGKTTLLETICGLKKAVGGSIAIDGRDVTRLAPGSRNVGYVPQDLALFNTKSVADHLRMGPQVRGWKTAAIEKKLDELLENLKIKHLRDRRPFGLSGGERQRVALGRALACNPPVLLLDEPLSALDEETHEEMIDLLKQLHESHAITVLHVTHRIQEAERLADTIYRFEDGKPVPFKSTSS